MRAPRGWRIRQTGRKTLKSKTVRSEFVATVMTLHRSRDQQEQFMESTKCEGLSFYKGRNIIRISSLVVETH